MILHRATDRSLHPIDRVGLALLVIHRLEDHLDVFFWGGSSGRQWGSREWQGVEQGSGGKQVDQDACASLSTYQER